ncbi:MAG: molybdenum cofactor biosynthesis protein MoaE [Desulfobacterales bacterium]|nr:molybdenum cofactor biosynthesis protein MoaE [Desulfobacterales bacterium]
MDLNSLLQKIKHHPDYEKAGMILCHNGVVRNSSRDGRKVTGLKIRVDHEKLRSVINTFKQKPGIIEILVKINENKVLSVGEDAMFLIVAGDIRDNVIPVLNDTLNTIKKDVTTKTEFFEPPA